MKKHPMQPIVVAKDGVARFKHNQIIEDLLDAAAAIGLDLNAIAARGYSQDDYSQLMKLIGYSVGGYGNLHQARKDHVRRADLAAEKLLTDG